MPKTFRMLELNAKKPHACGAQHGEELRQQIKEIAEIRFELVRKELTDFKTKDSVLELAQRHLPILKHFDDDLFEELLGIASGSGLSPEHIVILNHYTDMRDIKPAAIKAVL